MIRFLTYLIILLVCQTTSFSNEKSKFFEIGQKKYAEKKSKEQRYAKYQELKKEFENQLTIIK